MKSQNVIISGWLIAVFSLFSVSSSANPIPPLYLASVKQKGKSCNVEIQFYTMVIQLMGQSIQKLIP